jgi:hypothetical protein
MKPPFNVIHVIAHDCGASQEHGIDPALQQAERASICHAITPGQYRLVENPASIERMLAALREQQYHIVHFLGHGEIHKAEAVGGSENDIRRGYLRFIGADGGVQWVTGEQLEHLLSFTPTVQLAVLNACHSGANVTGNIALELTYNGLPYVVAIQSKILQDAAKYFIEAFYAELQRGRSIEYAVAFGRAAIAAHLPQTMDWCLPILYTNVGLPEQPPVDRAADRLWHWAGFPGTLQQLRTFNIVLGALHLAVGLLLLLSGKGPAWPDLDFVNWTTGILAVIPVLLTTSAYLFKRVSTPREWPFSVRSALVMRSLGSASIGLGLSIMYAWFVWILSVSVGFWEMLSPVARIVLLSLIFAPGILLSYSQITGHSRAFISNAQVEMPTFEWGEAVILIAGYMIILLPWGILTWGTEFLAPPWGNLLLGILLFILGWALRES